jgi:trehalose 6-phosphate phosphatase
MLGAAVILPAALPRHPMKYILSSRNVRELKRLARGRALVAFDFDGTLAPIVTDRDHAHMRPSTAHLFDRVCAAYPCAVVSGRSREDVAGRLGDAAVRYVVGEHGADDGTSHAHGRREIAAALAALRLALSHRDGIDLEVKRASLAIHYRRAQDRKRARATIDGALARLPAGVRLLPGKCVVNVVSARARHKGEALQQLLRLEGADAALYVGDDDTDEDAFRMTLPVPAFMVRVGRSRRSGADYYLRNQHEIDRLLQTLAAARVDGAASYVRRRA